MRKCLVMAAACVLLLATATAQEGPPSSVQADSMVAGENTGVRADTTDVVANAWNWYRPQRTWNYVNSSGVQRLWMDMNNSGDWIETNASNTQADQMNAAVTGNLHWLGIYWTSSTTWSQSQLWYY